jgi:sialic acid synthase SpsE/spore coat polysaccharide biosynthesis protein SpsF (cytidylyltransferase family)
MKKIAVIQARMLSSRLRGKSLMSVNGIPLIYRVIQSVKKMDLFDEIIVATTRFVADNPIESALKDFSSDVRVVRGDSENVLNRFVQAVQDFDENDLVARFTADNPIYNSIITRKVYQIHIDNQADYTYIDGLSPLAPEFVKVGLLREANRLTNNDFDREHVTPFIRKNATHYKIVSLDKDWDILQSKYNKYLTIDTREQLEIVEKMMQKLNFDQKQVSVDEIYHFLDNEIKELQSNESNIVNLDGVPVGDNLPAYIIAEIGQNHNGSVEIAKKLIDMAADAGANAVKFQKRDMASELTKEAFNKPYENPNSFGKTYGEHRIALELNEEQHKELKEYAQARGITYFVTPTDIPSVEMMERLNVPFYKVASRDLTNIPLLERLSKTKKPVIISTGMASIEDIDDAIEVLGSDRKDIIILQCISQYPADLERVNLKVMDTLKQRYGKIVGFSDHTTGIVASVTAAILGASVIEKHITLNKAMKGSDHAGSAEKEEFAKMIRFIRDARKTLGDGIKTVDPVIQPAKEKLARSLVSKIPIKKGTVLTDEMLVLKSPGTGLKWKDKHLIIGKKAIEDIPQDVTLQIEMFA